jgi:LEA14-like dessication related protein
MKFLIAVFALFVFNACTFYEPEYKGGEQLQLGSIDGRNIHFTAGAKVWNPNGFAIKVRPSEMDVYVGEDYIGKVRMEERVKMKRKRETYIESPFTVTLENGAMFRLMKYANKKEIQVRLTGTVKGAVWFVGKKMEINETMNLKTENFRQLGGFIGR